MSVGILGIGAIGKEVARVCSCLGMTVHGMKTTLDPVKHVDKVYTSNQLVELLQTCDYVCNILPSTSRTKGLLSNGILKVCEDKPIKFINIGRGDVIDEKSLVQALQNGWIEKAFLDVFEKEPLPAESPLWSFQNVTITPHVSGASVSETIPAEFIENLENYINGEELNYIFRWDKEY